MSLDTIHPLIADKYTVYETWTWNVNDTRHTLVRARNKETDKQVYLYDFLTEGRIGFAPGKEFETETEVLQALTNCLLSNVLWQGNVCRKLQIEIKTPKLKTNELI